jgi:general stress protein YciG
MQEPCISKTRREVYQTNLLVSSLDQEEAMYTDNTENKPTQAGSSSQDQVSKKGAGSASGESGRGWHGDPEGHAQAGRKGGMKVSQDRSHMAEIGRRGGLEVSRDREHMAKIGRKGGSKKG